MSDNAGCATQCLYLGISCSIFSMSCHIFTIDSLASRTLLSITCRSLFSRFASPPISSNFTRACVDGDDGSRSTTFSKKFRHRWRRVATSAIEWPLGHVESVSFRSGITRFSSALISPSISWPSKKVCRISCLRCSKATVCV